MIQQITIMILVMLITYIYWVLSICYWVTTKSFYALFHFLKSKFLRDKYHYTPYISEERNRGLERSSDLPKVSQFISGRA